MNLVLLLLLPASGAVDLAAAPAAASTITADSYNAFVATEETPALKELIVPAVLTRDRKEAAFAFDPRSFA